MKTGKSRNESVLRWRAIWQASVILLATTTCALANEREMLSRLIDTHNIELSNQASSGSERFVLDFDVAQEDVVFHVAVADGQAAVVGLDRSTGLPFVYMRDGLMVALDRDDPGALAVLEGGKPSVDFGLTDKGDISASCVFAQEGQSLVGFRLTDFLRAGLSKNLNVQTRRGQSSNVTEIRREHSTTWVVWQPDAPYPIRAVTLAVKQGRGFAINSIRPLERGAGSLLRAELEDFAAIRKSDRPIDPENTARYMSSPKELARDPLFAKGAVALAKALRVGKQVEAKIVVDRSLHALDEIQGGEGSRAERRCRLLVNTVDTTVIDRYVRRPQWGKGLNEGWDYDATDMFAYLLAEKSLSTTYAYTQALWRSIDQHADPPTPIQVQAVGLLGRLGVRPSGDVVKQLRKKMSVDKHPGFAIATASAFARLGLADDQELVLLCNALSEKTFGFFAKLDALGGLLAARAEDCEGYAHAPELFAQAAQSGQIHDRSARASLAMFAGRPSGRTVLLRGMKQIKNPNLLEGYVRALSNTLPVLTPEEREPVVAALVDLVKHPDVSERPYLVALNSGLKHHAPKDVVDQVITDALAEPGGFKAEWALSMLATQRRGGDFVELIDEKFDSMNKKAKLAALAALTIEKRAEPIAKPQAQRVFMAGLDDEDETVRWHAIKTLGILMHYDRLPNASPYLPRLAQLLDAPASDREARAIAITLHHMSGGAVKLDGVPRDSRGYFLVGKEANQWWAANLKPVTEQARQWVNRQLHGPT